MELSKGACFFCYDTKIITKPTHTVLSKIKSFLNNSAIDQDQLNEIKPLKVCPVCYHKLNLLVTLNNNISAADKNGTYSCTLCGSLDEIIKVAKWDTFDKISSDFPVLTGNISPVCSACLFFLNTRNLMKEKLISVYPNLRIDVKIPKFDDNITNHSTPIPKRRQRTLKSISSDVEKRRSDLSSSIKIKSLRQQSADLKLLKTVNKDHKFMNQILVIELQRLNGSIEEPEEFLKLESINKIGANVKTTRNRNKESKENKIVIKDVKTKTTLRRKEKTKIIELSSDSEQESQKRKPYFKIKLNKKKTKPVKKIVNNKEQTKQKLTELKNLVINLEQIKMPEENVIDEDPVEEMNVVESEDSIDLELKDDPPVSSTRIETTTAEDANDGDKIETSCDDKTQSTEENISTTNDVEKVANNDLEPTNDNVEESQQPKTTDDKNEDERNSDGETPEKNGTANEIRNYDSEATEKNDSDLDAVETDGTDEFVSKDDVETADDAEAQSKSEQSSATDANNVEDEQVSKEANKSDLIEENAATAESGNSSQDNSNSAADKTDRYSEIEAVLEGFETVSEFDSIDRSIDRPPLGVVTLDSSQDDEPGKRKRSDSASDANEPEKKKKKVTFCEDIVTDDD